MAEVEGVARDPTDTLEYLAHTNRVHAQRLDEMQPKVDEIYNILVNAKGAFKFFNWVGRVAKWITLVSAAATVLWHFVLAYLFTNPPPPGH
jgi:hypothetical protein